MIQPIKLKQNKIALFKNILINNDVITAYYIVTPYNYDVMSINSADKHVEKLYNAIDALYKSYGEIKLSMFKLNNIISKQETIDQIIETVRIYKKDYSDFPDEYKQFIKNITRDYTILAVNIDVKNTIDIENQNLKDIIKNSIDSFVETNFSLKQTRVNKEAISKQNIKIKNILQRFAIPASEKLVMNIFVNSIFPSYNLIYNGYLLDHKAEILNNIKQEIIPKVGWFEMTNSGIEDFGATPRTTYGSILTILEFPEAINSGDFNIYLRGLKVCMNLIPKEKALVKFKRMRAEILEEQEDSGDAGDRDSDINIQADLVQAAIDDLRAGRVSTELDANILVLADSKEELDKKKKNITAVLKDAHIVCSIAQDQGKTFVDSFIKNKPSSYYHLMDLQYALSFQIDQGVSIGDYDSKFAAPVIGIG